MKTELQEAIVLPELFDALPEAVILFKPVTGVTDLVTDFEITYCNHTACCFLQSSKPLVLGQSLLKTSLFNNDDKNRFFKKCLLVWQTGEPHEEAIYDEESGRHFSALRSKTKEGVISITRDRTAFFTAEKARHERLLQFTGILEASANGVMILEAIRNEENAVIDFTLTHCNTAAFTLARLSSSCIGKTLLEILPHLKNSEQFALHTKVLATGIPERIETTFRNEKGEEYGWFIVSLMKVGDSVVSTFIDISEKKNDEIKIEEQADLLESIFEASINGIFACEAIRNTNGKIIDLQVIKINKAFTQIVGIPTEIAEGSNYHSLFPSGRKAGIFQLYCNVIETGENFRKELFYDADNISGWYDLSAVKRGSNGIVVTFTNVTESKLNKQALEDSSRYLQDVINSSPAGIVLLSPQRNAQGTIVDFTFKTVNKTVAAIAGKEPFELVGKLHNDILKESVTNGLFDKYKEIAEGTAVKQRFDFHYTGNGIDAWLDVMAVKRNEDLLITFHNFTALKKLQVEIVESAKKLDTVLNTASAGMFTLHPVFNSAGEIEDFRFTIVNQAVAGYIGEKAENLVGALGSNYFPAYKSNGLFNIYQDTYLNNKEHQFDFHYEDGYDVYFNIHTIKAGDEVLVTFTDQTSLKKMQVQLEASIEELKKSNASLEEFAYAASHDLQEPLRKINYFAERLRNGLGQKLSGDEKRMFERMENAADRMSRLINDLLTYSQVSRCNRAWNTTSIGELIQQVLSDLETTIAEKKATVTVANMPVVHADPIQLTQLFQNIMGNSLKYSKKDTAPAIKISCNEITKETNGVLKDYYEIKISDNGIGFEQEHAEKIFKVFQRLHGQSEFPGTGIGLAIVYKVIENHHGFISAEGFVGEGSVFTILLPKA